MTTTWQILIVDDDPEIVQLLKVYLEQHGFTVQTAANGAGMRRVMERVSIDLVILDVMLPGEDGLSLCRALRHAQSNVWIIMLSASGEETDRVVGLEMGADDYIAKPFSPRELLARIKALMRRSKGELAVGRKTRQLTHIPNIRFLNWVLDRNKRQLIDPDGVAVPLSTGEYELLIAFIEHPHRILTRDQLLDLTRGREAQPFDRTIDVQVARLRKKIELDPKNPTIIMTVRGGGYQFNADVDDEPRHE